MPGTGEWSPDCATWGEWNMCDTLEGDNTNSSNSAGHRSCPGSFCVPGEAGAIMPSSATTIGVPEIGWVLPGSV